MFPSAIPALWLPIAQFMSEMLAHATKIVIAKQLDVAFPARRPAHILDPQPLLQLRTHFSALKDATDDLARETHAGALSQSYARLRERWLELFAPALTVLHNLDPMTLSALGIYSPSLAELLKHALIVSEKPLSDALEAEQTEITYDIDPHLCTLCLQIVRVWSDAKTISGGLVELSAALGQTIAGLDCFIKTNWTTKDLSSTSV